MAAAGAHLIGAMVGGVTSGGAAGGAGGVSVDEVIQTIEGIVMAVEAERTDVPVLIHGGPLNDLRSVSEVVRRTAVAGYVTGSTGERIPVERSVRDTVADFKSIRVERGGLIGK